MKKQIKVKGIEIRISDNDYISLTDIAKTKSNNKPDQIIQNWFRNRHTIEFLGIWEKIKNKKFNPLEFERLLFMAGNNSFLLSPSKWIKKTNSIGVISKSGKNGGTYAHKYIALAFASWISAEFELYLVSEFDRLKEKENSNFKLDWNLNRTLTKINYQLHTNAIKENLIPAKVTSKQIKQIYANESDILNIALFGKTAKEWKIQNKNKIGNMRDYSNISQLICLSNLENLNSVFIDEELDQSKRLVKLNQIAISQMKILTKNINIKKLGDKNA